MYFTWCVSLILFVLSFSVHASVNKTDAIYNTLFNIEKKWQALTDEQALNTGQLKLEKNEGQEVTLFNNADDKSAGIPVGELLFFSAYLRQYYLGELVAIKSESGAWIELNSLFEQLNFAITINSENLTAQGWYISPENRFELNLNNKAVVIKNEVYSFSEQDYYLDSGDVFVDSALLNQWFELNMRLNFNSLELGFSPKQVLPIEQKLQREERKISSNANNLEPTLPWKASPYQAVSTPVADLQLSYSANESNRSLDYSILGSQDLAYLKSEYYLAGQNGDVIRDSRLSFSREDASASLLGPLNATSIAFGDVLSTQIGSNFTSNYARGVKINNKPLYKKVNSNQINLTGAIQAGWDVELYRNKILIGQQLSLPDGRYLFENIDLQFGTNTFELIFYGPQGQVERRVEEYLIDGNSLNEGEGFYEFSLTQEGEQVLTTPNYFNDQQGWLLSGRYEQGVTDYFSVYAGTSALKNDNAENQNNYAFGSNLSIFNRVLINLDYEKSNDSEKELELAARTELAGQSLRFSMRKASLLLNASSHSNLYNDIDVYELFVSGNVMQNNYGQLSYQNTASHISSDTQQSTLRFGNSLNYYNSGYSFNNNLQWSDNDTFFGTRILDIC